LLMLQRWLSTIPQPQRLWVQRLKRAAQLSSLMATQSLLQMKLFFALPFFVLDTVLPLLGLSTSLSLWISACVGGGGAALLMMLHTPRGERLRAGPHA